MSSFRFVTDEDFDNHILRGLLQRLPASNIVRIQDIGLAGMHDDVHLVVLEPNLAPK